MGSLPEFAVVVLSDDGRDASVTVRGLVEARAGIVGSPEQVVVSGAGVTTWSERVIRSVASVELITPGSQAGVSCPIVDGIVSVARILLPIRRDETAEATSDPTLMPDRAAGPTDQEHQANGDTLHEDHDLVSGMQSLLSNTMMSPVEEAAVRPADTTEEEVHPSTGREHGSGGPGQAGIQRPGLLEAHRERHDLAAGWGTCSAGTPWRCRATTTT